MYAIIETGSKQYWVKPGQNLKVEKLEAAEGKEVELKTLWANSSEGTSSDAKAGSNSAKVTAQVVKHLRGPKIIIFKKRSKKGYQKTQGHRQDLTEIKITRITVN